MVNALTVVWASVKDWLRHIVPLTTFNLLWLVLSLTVVLWPPATVGLYMVTNRLAYGRAMRLADFGAGARRYFAPGLQWGLLNLAVFALFYSGVVYDDTARRVPLLVQVALTLMITGWCTVQFYFWPLLLEQTGKGLISAQRSALLLVIAAPGYTLILVLVVALGLQIGLLVPPVGLLLVSLLALLGNRAVIERLAHYGRPPDPGMAVKL